MRKRINRIHERVLRLVDGDSQDLSFSDSLLKDNSAIHQKNLQILATEIYKAKQEISPEIISRFSPFYTETM